MGIKGLTGLLNDEAPDCISQHDIKTFFGRKVAIDASMSLYQFLIAVRQQDGQQLMTESGETTSHLMGFFYRTLRMIDFGIKPMYVFDGAPPDLKKQVLAGRFGKREEARAEEEAEKDIADAERLDQLARRQVRPTRKHNDEVRELLKLMGIPCITAPSEAEAQCAELCRAGKVYAAGSEDMDTLTFGSPLLLKHLTFSEAKKMPVHEVNLNKALAGLKMEMPQFVDLCILMGCDYLDHLNGIGPKVALKLIREHETLENVVAHLRALEAQAASPSKKKVPPKKKAVPKKKVKKEDDDEGDEDDEDGGSKAVRVPDSDDDVSGDEYGAGPSRVPTSDDSEAEEEKPVIEAPKKAPRKKKITDNDDDWPYKEARRLFLAPLVERADDLQLKWEMPDVEGLVKFLCGDFGFSEDRVRKGADRLAKAMKLKQQGRLDSFFTVAPSKRKADDKDDKKGGSKKGKTGAAAASSLKGKGSAKGKK